MGLTRRLRQALEFDVGYDKCSYAYGAGRLAGTGLGLYLYAKAGVPIVL